MKNPLIYVQRIDWKNRRTLGALALIVVVIIASIFLLGGTNEESEAAAGLREVSMIKVADLGTGASGIAVPTANGNSYVVRSEASGKVLRAIKTGPVAQGAVIAQLESSAQRASLLQAEGVYESAVAASGGNETTQASARQDGVRTWTSATVDVAETLRTSIDTYFADIRGTGGTSGFKLESYGAAPEFNTARDSIERNILDRWESESVNESNVVEKLAQLNTDLTTIGSLIDKIAALVPRQNITNVYSESDRAADAAALSTARAAITTQQENVDSARTAITNASGSGDASAQAQVKQALGSLEAARAAYAKTTVRAPFAGTLTSVSVKAGDIVSTGGDIAIIVPNEGVETERRFVLPLSAVKYTPAGALVFLVNAEGSLESKSVETGLVTADSITVKGLNGDETIVKDVRGLKAGEKVEVITN
jgi:multidrug resistance efflux pump